MIELFLIPNKQKKRLFLFWLRGFCKGKEIKTRESNLWITEAKTNKYGKSLIACLTNKKGEKKKEPKKLMNINDYGEENVYANGQT